MDVKELCDKFDSTYELEGKKLNKVKDEIKAEIESTWIRYDYHDWKVWMYGQLFVGESVPADYEPEYSSIKDEMTERNKHLSATYHLTSMYDVIMKDME